MRRALCFLTFLFLLLLTACGTSDSAPANAQTQVWEEMTQTAAYDQAYKQAVATLTAQALATTAPPTLAVLPTLTTAEPPTLAALPTLTTAESPSESHTAAIALGLQQLDLRDAYTGTFQNPDITISSEAQSSLFRCAFRAAYRIEAQISAGVDLSAMSESDVLYSAGRNAYTIMLPPPALTHCEITNTQEMNANQSFCDLSFDEVRRLAEFTALEGFVDSALEDGILADATEAVEMRIDNTVQAIAGSVDVRFIYRDEQPDLPPSCQPEAPEGWYVDESSGLWLRDN